MIKRLTGLFLSATIALSSACSSNTTGPGAQDPTRQAEAEYDIARDLWLRRGQTREALEHALKAIDLDDSNAEITHFVALLYLDFCSKSAASCRMPEAERYARRTLELEPNFREARNTLAVTLIHQRKYAAAVSQLIPLTEDILYQTPENAWGNLGWAYLELGQLDKAIDALRRSIAAQPKFCVGNYRLALAYERRAEYALAAESFTRALETNAPGCKEIQEAWAGRARVHERLGDLPSARADLERCVALSGSTKVGKECSSILAKLK